MALRYPRRPACGEDTHSSESRNNCGEYENQQKWCCHKHHERKREQERNETKERRHGAEGGIEVLLQACRGAPKYRSKSIWGYGRHDYRRRLTVKLRGRPTTPDKRRGRTLSSRARGAKQTTPHGPLQRLLGAHSSDAVIITAAVQGVAYSW